jgi:alpha-tubulin suppressor-like RCC1 family protein
LSYTQVSAGNDFVSVLTKDGIIFTTGKNNVIRFFKSHQYGQLGDGTTIDRSTVAQISGSFTNISLLFSRFQQTLFIKDSKLYTYGFNNVFFFF